MLLQLNMFGVGTLWACCPQYQVVVALKPTKTVYGEKSFWKWDSVHAAAFFEHIGTSRLCRIRFLLTHLSAWLQSLFLSVALLL
jgi:hypothetical protein